MARRRKIKDIYSDNGTNFKGAAHELNILYKFFQNKTTKSKLIDLSTTENINWHFIPPNAPNFGGLWEAGVKSVKLHLNRVARNASLPYEQLYTLLVQIDAIFNSRPTTPLSNDPSDLTPLTPSHFLIGDTLVTYVEPRILHINERRLSKWQYIEQLRQQFWQRWNETLAYNNETNGSTQITLN